MCNWFLDPISDNTCAEHLGCLIDIHYTWWSITWNERIVINTHPHKITAWFFIVSDTACPSSFILVWHPDTRTTRSEYALPTSARCQVLRFSSFNPSPFTFPNPLASRFLVPPPASCVEYWRCPPPCWVALFSTSSWGARNLPLQGVAAHLIRVRVVSFASRYCVLSASLPCTRRGAAIT